MKTLMGITIAIALFIVGFAAGFPVGKSVGFDMGSEWALVQAEILAREIGVFMPVYLDNGSFRVVIKQPRHLYRTAWKLAEMDPDQTGRTRAKKTQERDKQCPEQWETRAIALRATGQVFTW